MALKFRRGTTAQKSGSLAFGEPYVNSTLGTLQIGGQNGDITLLINSASTGISGSSLDITGNAKIDGDLTLGGKITIGDASSDTVNVVASLSSSLIPTVTNAFDLGSPDKIWKDLYISTGSIKFIDGASVVNTFSSNTLTTILQNTGSTEARLTEIGVVSGSLISSASAAKTKNDSQDVSIDNINTFTGSQSTKNGNLATYTGSVETRLTQIGVVSGSLISSASANTISIVNLNTFSGSQLTQNTNLATITGSLISTASANTQKLTAIETISGSWITENETSSFARTNTTNIFTTNQIISGALEVTGIITANEFHTTFVTSSVMYNSGSNRFGDSVDDLQQLIGIVEITGSIKGTQFNNLATITGSLITSASSFESRNASLATITGSLISSASSFESRNASLATISGSLISTASNHEQRIAANESISSSYARTNLSNTFNNDQTFSGSIYLTGRIRAGLAVSASAVNINTADGNSQIELVNSTNGRGFHLISYDGVSFSVHNPITGQSAFRIDSGSQYHSHFFGDVNILSGSVFTTGISASVGYSGSINGIGNVTAFSSSIVSQFGIFNTETASLETRATQIGVVTGSLITSASSFESRNASLATITGSLISSASTAKTTNDSQDVSITNLNTFSGSQLTKDSTLQTYTASVDTRLTEISVVSGSLISSASAAKTKNDSQDVSLTNLNSYTASLQAGIQMTGSTVSILGDLKVYGTQSVITSTNVQIQDNIIYLSPTASIDNDLGIVGHYNDGTYRHAGIFMDASDGHTWKVFNGLTDETTAQVDVNGTGFALADFKAGVITGTSFNGIINATNGVISGSSQVNLASVTGNSTSNVTEGTNLYYLDSRVKTKLNAEGVISGSSQLTTEFDIRYLNTGADSVVSGSSQIDLTATTNYASGILTRLNAVGVVSGSSQINLGSAAGNITLGSQTTGDYVASLVAGTNITLSNNSGEGATPTIGLTNNAITIAGTSTSLGGTISAATIGNAIGAFSGSSQVSLGSASGNIALSTQTTGDYVASLVAGTGITLSNNTGEGATPTIAIGQSVATSASPTFAGLTINGAITATGDITAYYTSDKRHKNNIQIIPNALSKVRALNGVTWEWNDDVNEVTKSTPKTGLIAQEVQSVLPEVVIEKADGFLGLDYSKMMGLMVEAMKEQQLQIDKLTLKVAELEKQKGL